MSLIFLLIILLSVVTPFTLEFKVTQRENNCRHVMVTSWRYIEHINAEICGDQEISFLGKTIVGGIRDKVPLEDKK